ncbi:copper resistance protein CopC [Janibacter melonis]|uniref:copper resistance CopC family protein n=1 Tax=Janibacter melonis TaxID=262209 RepID=UPI002043D6F7|nr:copper resistance CopC family protein [Janibacter melonis]MCM3554118.1 copper resistance protein CopC [Janibacter melonis]
MTSARAVISPTSALRAALVACVAAVLALAGALPASAHAALVRSSPTSGSMLTAVPPEVALTFNEAIDPQFTSVTVKSGSTTASTGKPTVEGPTVYQSLDPRMDEGTYTVSYRVTSADGHPVSGSYTFTYKSSGGEDPEPSGSSTSEPSTTSSTSEPSTSSTSEPSSSSTSEPSSTSTTTSSSSSTSSTSSTSDTPSSSSTTTPSETTTEPSTTSSSPSTDEPVESTADGAQDGTPWWVWLLVALGGLALLGALVAYLRGRSERQDDEYDFRDDDLR